MRAPRFKVNRREIEMALKAEGKEQVRLLETTTKTWKGAKPRFKSTVNFDPAQAYVISAPSDPGSEGGKKWWWLELGTRVRYATMSRDFRAKTTRGELGSRAGKGHMVFVSRRHPRPGIKARNWRAAILKLRKRPFRDAMRAAFGRALSVRPAARELKR